MAIHTQTFTTALYLCVHTHAPLPFSFLTLRSSGLTLLAAFNGKTAALSLDDLHDVGALSST